MAMVAVVEVGCYSHSGGGGEHCPFCGSDGSGLDFSVKQQGQWPKRHCHVSWAILGRVTCEYVNN